MRTREEIEKEITEKNNLIKELYEQMRDLTIEKVQLNDDVSRYEEKYETVVVSKSPIKTEERLIGKIYWKYNITDKDTGKTIQFERNRKVRENDKWFI